ncbi:MAG: hypothetical protein ACHBN1_15245 [Heteroscytonema crispum UTEX LB 1556]
MIVKGLGIGKRRGRRGRGGEGEGGTRGTRGKFSPSPPSPHAPCPILKVHSQLRSLIIP